MKITEIRIRLGSIQDKVKAYCTVIFDGVLAVHDIRIVEGNSGRLMVTMPSRKIADCCYRCNARNHMLARYCNSCGTKLAADRFSLDSTGRPKLFVDTTHPIDQEFRLGLEGAVMEQYRMERGVNGGTSSSTGEDRVSS